MPYHTSNAFQGMQLKWILTRIYKNIHVEQWHAGPRQFVSGSTFVFGAPGSGKSRFLLELPRLYSKYCKGKQLAALYMTFNKSDKPTQEELQDEHGSFVTLRFIHGQMSPSIRHSNFHNWYKGLPIELKGVAGYLRPEHLPTILGLHGPTFLLIDMKFPSCRAT